MRNDLDGGETGSLRQQPDTSLQPPAMSRFVEFVVDWLIGPRAGASTVALAVAELYRVTSPC
ncbi:MAG: hypothetical protein WA849_01530 [Candidatus Udaeobacter sp.]